MKPFHSLFVGVAMCVATLPSYANDFYLCTGSNNGSGYSDSEYKWHSYYSWSTSELYKFKDVTEQAGTGKNTYQMTIERFSGVYALASISEDGDLDNITATLGASEIAYISTETLGNTIELSTFEEVKEVDNAIATTDYSSDVWNRTPIKHLVLTLTEEGDGKYSLKVEHATNHNIYPGVYSFLYVNATAKNGGDAYIDNRLIKAEGDNYTIHFDKLEGQDIRILDNADGTSSCISLGLRWNTTFYPSDLSEHAGEMALNHDDYSGTVYYTPAINGSFALNLYQGVNEAYGLVLWPGLDNVDLTFCYDLEHQDGEEVLETNANMALETPVSYALNNTKGKSEYEVTESMSGKYVVSTLSDAEKAVIFQNAYNGKLSISFQASEKYLEEISYEDLFKFTSSSDGWKAQTMTYDSTTGVQVVSSEDEDNELNLSDGTYMVYYYELPAEYSGSFYLIDDLDTSVTTFKGDASDSNYSDTYVNEDGEEETSAVVAFWSDSKIWQTVTEDGVPYFVKIGDGGTAKVKLYYNVANPSASLVQLVLLSGTVTGVDTILMDNEGINVGEKVEYYNLSGVKVSGNEPGLYIRRQGNRVNKVIIR